MMWWVLLLLRVLVWHGGAAQAEDADACLVGHECPRAAPGTPLTLQPCLGAAEAGLWEQLGSGEVRSVSPGSDGLCPATDCRLHPCSAGDPTQGLYLEDNGLLHWRAANVCAQVQYNSQCADTPLGSKQCDPGRESMTFVKVPSNVSAAGYFRLANSNEGQCAMPCRPITCTDPPISSMPFCDRTRGAEDRAADLVGRMSAAELAGQITENAVPLARLGIERYWFWNEALHGVGASCAGPPDHQCPTTFPAPVGMGAAFNRTLFHAVGAAIGLEGRALNNAGVVGGLDFWAPNLNLNRDPRWGRNQEAPGEDPLLTGEYGAEFIKGMQESSDPRYTLVVATPKHYVANSMEDAGPWSRHDISANISAEDLTDYYLAGWERAVREGRPRSLMCSYNAVNGVPMCANHLLIEEVLRGQWGFDGYVVSDCGAVGEIATRHHYVKTLAEAARVALEGGCDLNCGSVYQNVIPNATANGSIPLSLVQRAATRVFKQKIELGMFDSPEWEQPYARIGLSVVDSGANRALALEAGHQSIVLLANPSSTLPLKTGLKLAVIGPHVNSTKALLSDYHGWRCSDDGYSCMETPAEALTKANEGGSVTVVQGCGVTDASTAGIPVAVQAALHSEAVVLLLGLNTSVEREEHDRTTIDLPGVQPLLAAQVLALGKPTVVVLLNGGQLAVEDLKKSHAALVEAFYPGEYGARAIADVVFGGYNPDGKLPYTVYPAHFVNDTEEYDFRMRPGVGNPGRTYRYYTGDPLWWFGYGLSYTTFHLEWESGAPRVARVDLASWSAGAVQDDGETYYRVRVTNTGAREGAETVVAYWVPPPGSKTALRKSSFDFQKRLIGVNDSVVMPFFLPPASLPRVLATADEHGRRVAQPGVYTLQFSRGHGEVLTTEVVLTGAPVHV